jgi:uncharacterized protein (TIGR02147 family)
MEIDLPKDSLQPPTVVQSDAFWLISDWYHFAILELLDTSDFQDDSGWIAARLGLSLDTVEGALERLLRTGLMRLEGGKYRKTNERVMTTEDIESQALRMSHRQSLNQAIGALDEIQVRDRDISSITMAVDVSKLPLAKELIRDFRRRLAALLESGERTEVYNLNIQLLPVTRKRLETE